MFVLEVPVLEVFGLEVEELLLEVELLLFGFVVVCELLAGFWLVSVDSVF